MVPAFASSSVADQLGVQRCGGPFPLNGFSATVLAISLRTSRTWLLWWCKMRQVQYFAEVMLIEDVIRPPRSIVNVQQWNECYLRWVPPANVKVYVGHIPHELFEDSIVPLFEQCGKIWDLCLMMDPMSGKNRGYAFLTFCEKAYAAEAAKKYDGHEISHGNTLKVNVSVANTRLFLGNIPKSTKSKRTECGHLSLTMPLLL
ncbi:hypothetical protein ANCCAN_10749 [Ancylostoma caninum]|uniref:RRM domain-containing protein n=1 Tax=Ancylostoma caninum TaxID=29170 RepID=A0A368GJN7_ANCCA|nr:hypothetical protein ANCCAN_10749 [Ancylostoma caninum]